MWYEIDTPQQLSTPSLVVYPDRIRDNISLMLAQVGEPTRLCPHVKTHKTHEISRLYADYGVTQFKCSTIAEMEMAATSGAQFVLLAVQPVGPVIERLTQIAVQFPNVQVATVFDNQKSLDKIASAAMGSNVTLEVFPDIDNGMQRTGIRCGAEVENLYRRICSFANLIPGGLHVYDGHIHDRDAAAREQNVTKCMEPVLQLRDQLVAQGLSVPRLITGGTPSFPIHAKHPDRICSPGTPVLWDAGYAESFPDLTFHPAAVLLTRVLSQLSDRLYCTDLGHKAIASEMQPPRARFLNAPITREIGHSEEHLVVEVEEGCRLSVGDVLYVIPHHICPTVAKHPSLLVVEDGIVTDNWRVTARDRMITI